MKKVVNKSKPHKSKVVEGMVKVEIKDNKPVGSHTMVGVDNKVVFDRFLHQAKKVMSKSMGVDGAEDESFILAFLQDIEPQDMQEGMLAVQMLATHSLSMEMSARALLWSQTNESVTDNLNRMAKLQRLFIKQMDALQKKRNRGQVIQVQHVNVESGGQAVVANVSTTEGD